LISHIEAGAENTPVLIEQQTIQLEVDEDSQPSHRLSLLRDVTEQSAREHELNEQL